MAEYGKIVIRKGKKNKSGFGISSSSRSVWRGRVCPGNTLELTKLPVVGCGVLASALCMDKDRAHKLVSLEGIRVPKAVLICNVWENQESERAGTSCFCETIKAGFFLWNHESDEGGGYGKCATAKHFCMTIRC